MATIRIRGARTHNLKNIDLDLPRDKLIVITGLSGSGKSSLAFDTIYAEGQRRYVESLSAYARQFLSIMEKPDVDHIEGLSPAISIEQKSTSHNPRSTVGTITEVYDYLRLLFARVGTPRCPDHGIPLQAQTVSQMVDAMLALDPEKRFMLLAPIIRERKGEHVQVFDQLRAQGFVRARVDGAVYDLDAVPPLMLRQKHSIEVVVDRFRPRDDIQQRLAESFETALRLGDGLVIVVDMDDASAAEQLYSSRFSCPVCDYSLPELEPRLFSFNSPVGACSIRREWSAIRSCRCPPAQCAAGTGAIHTTSRCCFRSPRITVSMRTRAGAICLRPFRRPSCTAAARKRSRSATSLTAAARSPASTRSRASCRTSNGATRKPNPPPCARSWPNTFPTTRARPAEGSG
jgi:excinuclease ABC A subunit